MATSTSSRAGRTRRELSAPRVCTFTIYAIRGIEVYVRYVQSCLHHTPIKELVIGATMHTHEKTAWMDMDETIVRSLTAFPRPNFVLRLVLRPYATQRRILHHLHRPYPTELQSEAFVRNALPKCVGLGVVRIGDDSDSESRARVGRRKKSGTVPWDRCYRWVNRLVTFRFPWI